MAIPSGGGTEVFCRGFIPAQTSDATNYKWDGTNPAMGTATYVVPTHTICILKNFIVSNRDSGAETFTVSIGVYGTSTLYMRRTQAIANNESFIWNETLVLHAGDFMSIWAAAGDAHLEVIYNYIKQDWS